MSTPQEPYSGTATIGAAEYSLPGSGTTLQTLTTPGIYSLLLDLSALTAAEQYTLSVYEAVRSGGTKRLLDTKIISGAQTLPVYLYQPTVPLMNGWDMTLTKNAGTDRSIAWSIRRDVDSDISAIKAKTDNLPAAPASEGNVTAVGVAVSTLPSAAAIAAAVWSAATRTLSSAAFTVADIWAYATRTLTSGAAPSAASIAVAVVDQTLAGHTTAGTVGGALQAAGAGGDPLAQLVPGSYAAGTGGYALGKLNVPTPETPVVVVPGPPAITGACRVYGYVELPDKTPAAKVSVKFELMAQGAIASDRLIADRIVNATTDATGQLTNSAGNAWVDLNRTDTLTQAAAYEITCEALGVRRKRVQLAANLADLRTLLTS